MRSIKRDGWEVKSSQKDALHQTLPTYISFAFTHQKKEDLWLFAIGQILFQIKILEVPTKLSDQTTQLCFCLRIPPLSQKDGSLACIKCLSSQSQKKDRGLKEKLKFIHSLGIHAIVEFTAVREDSPFLFNAKKSAKETQL